MEHPPRFDSKTVDPICVKSSLTKLANKTLYQLLDNSPLKDKIFIGSHSLECAGIGATFQARFLDQRTGQCDGVHMYGQSGRSDYTDSVKTILMLGLTEKRNSTDDHKSCPQALYQKRYNPIELKNRFSVFNSNQGNF